MKKFYYKKAKKEIKKRADLYGTIFERLYIPVDEAIEIINNNVVPMFDSDYKIRLRKKINETIEELDKKKII